MIGALSVGAMIAIISDEGWGKAIDPWARIGALILLSAALTLFSVARERRSRELNRVRSVAEYAQRVLLRPPPHRLGPLRVAWLYLTAEDETKIGGDLFAVARSSRSSTRIVIGDVRGKGVRGKGVRGKGRPPSARHRWC